MAKNINFELVYISLDENEKKCLETFRESHGNWFLWPFNSELKKLTFIINFTKKILLLNLMLLFKHIIFPLIDWIFKL